METLIELDISRIVQGLVPENYFASVAEKGENAGKETWNNAKSEVEKNILIEDIEFLRHYFYSFGAWEKPELEEMTEIELNAILLQMISLEIRELPLNDDGEIDFDKYKQGIEEGCYSGMIFEHKGKIYILLDAGASGYDED